MRKILSIITVIIALPVFCQNGPGERKIKTAVYWTCPWMTSQNADSLARHDLVIADLENMVVNRESLVKMKKLNPKIKLICYSNPMEIFDPGGGKRPLQNAWSDSLNGKYKKWLLKTGKGKKAIFYPGMRMLNLSSSCPKITIDGQAQTYGEWMSAMLIQEVLADSLWDGYFLDNGGGNISWVYGRGKDQIDADGDGQKDNDSILDRRWSEGVHSFLKAIREAKGEDFILMANKGCTEFMDLLDGRMFEFFPNDYLGDATDGGWHQSMANARLTGPYTIFQVSRKDLDFGLASALLLDNVYIASDQNDARYHPQYRGQLGREEKIYKRDFQKARVEVIPSERKGKVFFAQ